MAFGNISKFATTSQMIWNLAHAQKQPLEVFYNKSCSYKFRNIHREKPVLEFFFVGDSSTSVNIAKFLRIPITQKAASDM